MSQQTPDNHAAYYGGVITQESIDLVLEKLHVTMFPEQREVVYSNARYNLVSGGERAGKSFTASLYATPRIPFGRLFWFVGRDYELARPEFRYVVEMLGELGAIGSQRDISMPKVGKCSATLKSGQLLETKSADEVQKLAAMAPDGVVMCEAAQHPYESYLRLAGRVAEKRGWLLMCGTFEGSQGWYPELFSEWAIGDNPEHGISFSIPSWANTFVYPLGRRDPEIKRLETVYRKVDGMFEERCAAVPVPATGLVFREFRRTVHIDASVHYDPMLPVYLAVDPSAGGAPYSVLACQFRPCACSHPDDRIEDCFVVDEIYEQGKIGEQVQAIAMNRPWWPRVKGGAIDAEAPDEQRRWMANTKVYLKCDKVQQIEGIRRLKTFLHYAPETKNDAGVLVQAASTHLHIHPKVEGLPYEFTKYKRKDPTDDDMLPKELPPSNQPNHSIKALWYLLIARYGSVKGKRAPAVALNWRAPLSVPRGVPTQVREPLPYSKRRSGVKDR